MVALLRPQPLIRRKDQLRVTGMPVVEADWAMPMHLRAMSTPSRLVPDTQAQTHDGQ